jgi:hypothetical protein
MNRFMVAACLALVSGGVLAGEASAQSGSAQTGGVPVGGSANKSPDQSEELAKWVATRDQRMAWWREARFGMFVHWGLYSGAGGAWDGKVYPQHYAEWIQHWAAVPCAEYARQMKPLFRPIRA